MAPASNRLQHPDMLLILCLFAFISLLTAPVAAIRCHQCNSALDEGCDDVNNTFYLKDCKDDGKAGSDAFCRKMVQKVLYDGRTRVIRACGWQKARQPCYRYDDDDHSEVVCQCFEEGCNSAPRRLAALLSLTWLPALLARL